jgi:hypothetical protein
VRRLGAVLVGLTFEQWVANARDLSAAEAARFLSSGRNLPAREYAGGWLYRNGETWIVPLPGGDRTFGDLASAEACLWRDFVEGAEEF